jgi:hypothetical protein
VRGGELEGLVACTRYARSTSLEINDFSRHPAIAEGTWGTWGTRDHPDRQNMAMGCTGRTSVEREVGKEKKESDEPTSKLRKITPSSNHLISSGDRRRLNDLERFLRSMSK